jgi:peptidoglycan/xylan/chitin deacetylase (PgdA/CDA1 family)
MVSVKRTVYRLVAAAWNSRLPMPGADRGDTVSIVCLHGVHTPEMERICRPPTSSVSVASFEANIRALAQHYRIISLEDAVAMLKGELPWQPRCAVLTFDDSLKCTGDVAFQVLAKLGMTATVFVSTEAIEKAQPYWWLRMDHLFHRGTKTTAEAAVSGHGNLVLDLRDAGSLRRVKSILRRTAAPERDAVVSAFELQGGAQLEDCPRQFPYATTMSWDDVRAAIARGFSVGSHTVTHPNLSILNPVETRQELEKSKHAIEAETDLPCRHICYPYGAFNESVATIAEACGYEAATSTVSPGRNRPTQNRFALRRYSMPSVAPKLGYMMTGVPDILASAKATIRRRRRSTTSPLVKQ